MIRLYYHHFHQLLMNIIFMIIYPIWQISINHIMYLALVKINDSSDQRQIFVKKGLQQKAPNEIPEVGGFSEDDLDALVLVNKKSQKNAIPEESSTVLKIMESSIKKNFNHKDYLKPLLQINYNKNNRFTNDARLLLCENIIEGEEVQRITIIDYHLNFLENLPPKELDDQVRFRIILIRAGRYVISGEYLRASLSYIEALRMNSQANKINIIEKAISCAFLEPSSPQAHKAICTLYMHELVGQSKLKNLVAKMYSGQMISAQEVSEIAQIIPKKTQQGDEQGVTALSKAAFSHNMNQLIKSFKSISFKSAVQLIGIKLQQLVILIEKTYKNGQILIDQVSQLIYLKGKDNSDDLVRELLEKIDEIIS